MSPLEQAILRTVAYFDIFSYPLTMWEVWKWLFSPVIASPAPAGRSNPDDTAGSPVGGPRRPSASLGTPRKDGTWNLADVVNAIETSSVLEEKIDCKSGFVFLKGRDSLVAIRQERYRLALEKLDRAKRFTRTLVRIPFVRAVFACNSLGFANARAESDIDFFIIAERGHLWIVRLLAAGWAKFRKLRPVPGNRADKFCLSFFLSDDSLDLSAIRLEADPYLTMWLATLVPIYDPDNLRLTLWQSNTWAQTALPNAAARGLAQQRKVPKSNIARILVPIFRSSLFERMAERMQQRVLAPNLRTLANQDTRVILNRHMLKFHDNDRRQEYRQALASRLSHLGV